MTACKRTPFFTRFALGSIFLLFGAQLSSAEQLGFSETGQTGVYQITGTGFGEAPRVEVHDDFEDGRDESRLTGWELGSSHGSVPVYSSDASVSGNLSGKSSFIGSNYNSSAEYKNLNNLRSVYLSYYVKIDQLSGNDSRNIKLARITSGYSGSYSQPSVGTTLFDIYSNGYAYTGPGEGQDSINGWFGSYSDGQWHRIEHYVELSNPAGENNGQTIFSIDGKPYLNEKGVTTDYFGNSFQWLTLPYYVAHDPGGDYVIYYDNVVLSHNRARVEMCTTERREDCKMPIVAKIINWTDSSISIDLNAIDITEHRYAFIYNFSGTLLNTDGLALGASVTCPQCPQPPELQLK